MSFDNYTISSSDSGDNHESLERGYFFLRNGLLNSLNVHGNTITVPVYKDNIVSPLPNLLFLAINSLRCDFLNPSRRINDLSRGAIPYYFSSISCRSTAVSKIDHSDSFLLSRKPNSSASSMYRLLSCLDREILYIARSSRDSFLVMAHNLGSQLQRVRKKRIQVNSDLRHSAQNF